MTFLKIFQIFIVQFLNLKKFSLLFAFLIKEIYWSVTYTGLKFFALFRNLVLRVSRNHVIASDCLDIKMYKKTNNVILLRKEDHA